MTYSIDFRKKVLSIKEKEKLSFSQTAKRFGVSVNSIFLWSKSIEPKRTRQKAPVKIHDNLLLFECNINTEAFSAWVKQELLPVLPPKSVIVMDNASFSLEIVFIFQAQSRTTHKI